MCRRTVRRSVRRFIAPMRGGGQAPMQRSVGNLPTELSSFVGRDAEVADVERLLSEFRLVTLTGVGGVGKTRLALRTAAQLQTEFPDGVWLVPLDRLRDETLVPQAIAAVLGLQERAGYSGVAALADYVAQRRLLLVLDNCEHLGSAVARLAEELIAASPGARLLATSREPLARRRGDDGPGRAPPAARRLAGADRRRADAVLRDRPVPRAGGGGPPGLHAHRDEPEVRSSRSACGWRACPSPSSSPPRSCASSRRSRSTSDCPTGCRC